MTKRNRDRSVLEQFADAVNHCEAVQWLDCCDGDGCHNGLHIHHVLGGPNRIDAEWNIVRLCLEAHDWVHRRPQAGKILCWHILDSRGAFDPVVIRQWWKKCPLGVIEWALPTIQEDWIRRMGEVLLQKHSRGDE
jgi:hypothetical protein